MDIVMRLVRRRIPPLAALVAVPGADGFLVRLPRTKILPYVDGRLATVS
ncbi:hypothetical protein [Nonomuraea basaltis]|nr:hypothetical protein [Nonomuraea basaltis]